MVYCVSKVEEHMATQYVRCCERTREADYIWLDEECAVFRYIPDTEPFEYCPFCGILLDLNLEMSE